MAQSLKEQLLKAGLKPAGKGRISRAQESDIGLSKAYQLRDAELQRQKQEKRQKKLADDKRRREINNKLRQVVATHAVRDPAADIARNFMFKGRIRRVLVNKSQLQAVNTGALVIVYLAGSYHLVPSENAVEVREIAPDHVPDLGADNSPDDDEFPVPYG